MVILPGVKLQIVLDPMEVTCPICETNETLIYSERSERNALLLCVEETQIIQVRVKECPLCKLKVSYKDHEKNIFNYNDNLVFSHRLLDKW